MIPLWTIPLATVTGNTLILKPSERDPGAAMILAELCERAGDATSDCHPLTLLTLSIGLPPGVLNIVHGSVPTVNAICDHPDIKAVSFVGGDKAGKHIYHRFVLPSHPFARLPTRLLGPANLVRGCNVTWVPRTTQSSCRMVCIPGNRSVVFSQTHLRAQPT